MKSESAATAQMNENYIEISRVQIDMSKWVLGGFYAEDPVISIPFDRAISGSSVHVITKHHTAMPTLLS